jgi:hypothetical protein
MWLIRHEMMSITWGESSSTDYQSSILNGLCCLWTCMTRQYPWMAQLRYQVICILHTVRLYESDVTFNLWYFAIRIFTLNIDLHHQWWFSALSYLFYISL